MRLSTTNKPQQVSINGTVYNSLRDASIKTGIGIPAIKRHISELNKSLRKELEAEIKIYKKFVFKKVEE